MEVLELEEQTTVRMVPSIRKDKLLKYLVVIPAVVYVVISLYLIITTRRRLASATVSQQAAMNRLERRQGSLEADLKISNEVWAERLGWTTQQLQEKFQQGLQSRTSALQRQQQAVEQRLQLQNDQIDHISGEVADVRGDLGGTKKEVAETRTDLESTKVKLERAIGDLTGQSSLIARTREDLEELRHRGDRNYYEFTLYKGTHPTQVSTVRLQLKKADPKKSKFTLTVSADDRVIEKKDRGAGEPLQFYTGRDRALYEVVIFTVEKNKVAGYLSTPKSASTGITR